MPPHGKKQHDFHGTERHADKRKRHIVLQEQQQIKYRHK